MYSVGRKGVIRKPGRSGRSDVQTQEECADGQAVKWDVQLRFHNRGFSDSANVPFPTHCNHQT
jgi:hypothetical protein